MDKRRKMGFCLAGFFLLIVLVTLDQCTKALAVLHLKDQPNIILAEGIMELQYLENRGAAFGMLQNQQWLFILLFLVFVVMVSGVYIKLLGQKKFIPLQLSILLIIAGGLGNLIDRIRLGYVVDFFYFSLINFPIFNVADIYVTVGMALLILLLSFVYKDIDVDEVFSIRKRKEKS